MTQETDRLTATVLTIGTDGIWQANTQANSYRGARILTADLLLPGRTVKSLPSAYEAA